MDTMTVQKAEEYSRLALDINLGCSTAHVVLALLKIWNGILER